MGTVNEEFEQAPMKVCHDRGDVWQKLFVTYCTGLHVQGKADTFAPLPSWPLGCLPFPFLALSVPFVSSSPPGNPEVHVCHLLWTP